MRALVTGAAGFIGSHVVERLAAAGHNVRGMVRTDAQEATVRDLGAAPVRGDVTCPATLRAAADGMDTVIHVAARVTDWGEWPAFEAATVRGTINTLRSAAEAGVRRFVLVSSVAVYDNRVGDRLHVVPEDTPHNGVGDRLLGHYSRAKVLAEEAAWEFHARGDLEVTALRPAWVYGPRDRTVLPRLVEYMNLPFSCWFGRRDPVVDPIYVTDVADCIILAATHPQAAGQTYNVAPPEEIHLRYFLRRLGKTLGVRVPRWTIDDRLILTIARGVEAVARCIGMREPPFLTVGAVAIVTCDRHYDPRKAMQELGWKPAVSLDLGIDLTAEWFRTRPEIMGGRFSTAST
ncbi:MAG TPA: NAD-dependent epimerase/dehydratase family protein [Gemmataceae bacterium]|jgi:nucleoside-diphosphate-sugar epimerase|nr:NAD-dependent epimerase/dehydratase family protein [Gemmataceae bacterium]